MTRLAEEEGAEEVGEDEEVGIEAEEVGVEAEVEEAPLHRRQARQRQQRTSSTPVTSPAHLLLALSTESLPSTSLADLLAW